MEAIDEPPMARDFFRRTPRDASPTYRWARRSRSRSAASKRVQDARGLQNTDEDLSPLPQRYGAPAPLTLPSVRTKSLVVDPVASRTAASTLTGSTLKFTPCRKSGLTTDGADSPTGPLEFPASPSSSSGSFKEVASPVPNLGPMRSMRLPSPNRGPPRQGSSLFPATPDVIRRSAGKLRSGAQSSSPAVQKQVEASSRVTGCGPAVQTRDMVNAAKDCGPGEKVENAAGSDHLRGKAAPRHTTPFHRGLDAIKGRLFSDARKSSDAAAAEEIRTTQKTLSAAHNVKPAASSGIKSRLVSRLTRLGRSARSMAPPPLAIQEAAPSASSTQTAQPAPGLLTPPNPLAFNSPVVDEPMQADKAKPKQGLLGERRLGVDAASGSQQGHEHAGEKEARQVEEEEEEVESRLEGETEVASSWVDTPVTVGRSVGWTQGMESRNGKIISEGSPLKTYSDSDSDHDSPIPSSLSRLSFQGATTPGTRRPSWAQHVPLAASPAASWDSQSSLEFATSHRPSIAQRFLSSESSSSEQGSPRCLERSRASPLGVTFGMTSGSLAARDDDGMALRSASPAVSSSPAFAAPSVLSPPLTADLAPRRQPSSLSWPSDEEEEDAADKVEDRSCHKRDMAAALHQLREFQAGGTTPRRSTDPLQRSLTDAAVMSRRTTSPMRTLWRQASAAVGGEGTTSSPARMTLAAAGRALSSRSLSRSRDRSPCPSGLLASPRPLLAEPSPLRARPGAFDDGPRAGPAPAVEARLGRSTFVTSKSNPVGAAPGRFAKTPGRARPIAAAAAFFRSMTPGRQRAQVM